MNVILVDDEPLALEYLESLLNKNEYLNVIGKYTNPLEAKRRILTEKPMLVFLDIEMPEITGIELAEEILQSLPETQIVFVTAFNDYAIKAFELNAVDYLIKPVLPKRLQNTLQRLELSKTKQPTVIQPKKIDRICVFQSLAFTRSTDTREVLEVKWRTTRARALFAYFVQHRNKFINRETLLDTFWPDVDSEKSITQLYSTIYQIRRTLSSIQFNITISNHDNGYRLNLNDVKVDSEEYESGLKANPVVNNETIQMHRQLLSIYQNEYLSEENFIWAENERERLRILWIGHISKVADYLASKNEYGEAISLYHQMQTAVPHIDHSYFKLMKLLGTAGDFHAVSQQYTQLKKMLLEEYGVEPKSVIQEWYKNWLQSVAIGD